MTTSIEIFAKDLQIGDKYKSGKTIQEVKEIVKITDKTIEYRTKRVYPDLYDGNFYQKPHLGKKLIMVNYL